MKYIILPKNPGGEVYTPTHSIQSPQAAIFFQPKMLNVP
jgi:hypothetical protein